jgi:hypothetical protein
MLAFRLQADKNFRTNFFMEDIQDLLKKADEKRKSLNMSRKEWLRTMGITESNYYRWTKGETTPSFRFIRKLLLFV